MNTPGKNTPVKFSDLLDAFYWVDAGGPFQSEAFIHRASGKIYWSSIEQDFEGNKELPDDVGDETLYTAVPNKRDLDLGRSLALRFARDCMPDAYDTIYGHFSRRGAYPRFKALLERSGQLEAWHKYENEATEQALRDWCEIQALQLDS